MYPLEIDWPAHFAMAEKLPGRHYTTQQANSLLSKNYVLDSNDHMTLHLRATAKQSLPLINDPSISNSESSSELSSISSTHEESDTTSIDNDK
jgi:hypothetical protein